MGFTYPWEAHSPDNPDGPNYNPPGDSVNNDDLIDKTPYAKYWGEDSWLYTNTGDRIKNGQPAQTLAWFRDRYPGATREQYDYYVQSFENGIQRHQQVSETELTNTYWSDMQAFMEAQPGYEAYSKFIPEHLRRISELEQGQMDPYTGQLTVQDPWQRKAMLARQGQDYFGGIDQKYDEFGGMFKSTKDALLPQMDKNFKEQVSDPMAERLEMLGLSGASPGMEMTAGVGQDFAIDKAMAGANADNVYAGQMMNVEQARQGAMGATGQSMVGLMGMGEATQRANIGTEYQDWMAHQQDPFQRLGMGTQNMGISAGALSTAAGQSIQAAEIPYAQGSAWDMMNAENTFMAPYYEAMSKSPGGGGGKK